MSVHKSPRSSEQVQDAIEDLKIKSESSDEEQATITLQRPPNLTTPTKSESSASEDDIHVKHMLKTNMKKSRTRDASQTPQTDPTIPHEELVGGEVIVKEEPGKPLKLARNSSQKVMAKPAPLYDHLPDATTEATEHFEVIRDNIYSNKHIGRTDDEGYECECDENWGKSIFLAELPGIAWFFTDSFAPLRLRRRNQPRLRRQLYQSFDESRMCARMSMRPVLPESTLSAAAIC